MDIEPLPRHLFDKLVAAGVEQFGINFSGGSDEGYISIWTTPYSQEMERAIDEWQESVYDYGGAGDGNEYGDDITYDLVEKIASHQEWYTSRVDGESSSIDFELGAPDPLDDLLEMPE